MDGSPQPGPDAVPVDPDLPPTPWLPGSATRWDVVGVVAAGGALGGGLRYVVNSALPATVGRFPWATFAENVSGALALGALMVVLLEVRRPGRYARPFLGTGVLGGYTTFSTFTADTTSLLRDGHAPVAAGYLAATVVVGLVACRAGQQLTRRLTGQTTRT